jgi:hypothetical protein
LLEKSCLGRGACKNDASAPLPFHSAGDGLRGQRSGGGIHLRARPVPEHAQCVDLAFCKGWSWGIGHGVESVPAQSR